MKAFILACLLACTGQAYADGELILKCMGQLATESDIPPNLGKKIELEIGQTPERDDYRWFLRVIGDVTVEERTNGPINADGSSVAPSGEENQVMFRGLAGGILLKTGGTGILHFIDEFPLGGGKVGYQLIEYELLECIRSPCPGKESS